MLNEDGRRFVRYAGDILVFILKKRVSVWYLNRKVQVLGKPGQKKNTRYNQRLVLSDMPCTEDSEA